MTGVVVRLFRYPVKGLSPEPMETLALTHAHGIERDRKFALALGTTEFDPAQPQPLAKTNFLMLAKNEALARLRTQLDPDHRLTVRLGGRIVAEGVLDDPAGRTAIEDFFTAFVGDAARGRVRVVSAPDPPLHGHRRARAGVHGLRVAHQPRESAGGGSGDGTASGPSAVPGQHLRRWLAGLGGVRAARRLADGWFRRVPRGAPNPALPGHQRRSRDGPAGRRRAQGVARGLWPCGPGRLPCSRSASAR